MHQASNPVRSLAPSNPERDQDEEGRRRLLIAVLRGDCSDARLALATLPDGKSAQHALRVVAGLGHADIASMIIQSALPNAADALDGALAAAIKNSQTATVRQLLLEASRFAKRPALVKSLYSAATIGAVDFIDEIMSGYRPANKILLAVFRLALVEKRWSAAAHIFDGGDARLFERLVSEANRSNMEAYRALRRSDAVRDELDMCTKPLASVRQNQPRRRV